MCKALINFLSADDDEELLLLKDDNVVENNWNEAIDCILPNLRDLTSVCGLWVRDELGSSKLQHVCVRYFNGYVYTDRKLQYKKDILFCFLKGV